MMNVMSLMFDRAAYVGDVVHAEELGIDAGEFALGIVHIMAISFRKVDVVVLEDSDGLIGIGHSAAWPGQDADHAMARTRAREKAKKRLLMSRENHVAFLERKQLAAQGWVPPAREPVETLAGDCDVTP